MSGFAGIIHLDSSPVDRELLQRLVDFQKFRGPDAQNVWFSGHVGLGHTLLKVYPESESEHQPFSLDGQIWIVADCRVDARSTLVAQLQAKGHQCISEAPDVELILRAYSTWGKDCVQYLLGDFAFAIWDGPHRRLFCARDQIGVKPFYYAHVGHRLIFSNTLACIRQHPAVSGTLDDLAIADFLIFDTIQQPGATSFKDIQRLPPAHTLAMAGEGVSSRRYWSLPISAPIRQRTSNDTVDKFRELLGTAVADRLRTNAAGVMMSGGLDSATVAASAQRISKHQGHLSGLCAYTEVFDSLIPHEERHYARLVAEELGIPIEIQSSDNLGIWNYLSYAEAYLPEPWHSPCSDCGVGHLRRASATRRVVLTGYGGDPALSCSLTSHFMQLIKKRELAQALIDGMRYLAAERRFSRLYIRTRLRRRFALKSSLPQYPKWLNPDLEKCLMLRERWEDLTHRPTPNEGIRPIALEALSSSMWAPLFEFYDCGVTHVLAEVSHPFFDLRLLGLMLSLPALPLCSDKELLRQAGRGVLPDAVRLRRKSPLIADPLVALLQRKESAWVDSFTPCSELDKYVRRDRLPKVLGEKNAWSAWINLRPHSLNFWLRPKDEPGYTCFELYREIQFTKQEAISKA